MQKLSSHVDVAEFNILDNNNLRSAENFWLKYKQAT
jgi:hypothetical protein